MATTYMQRPLTAYFDATGRLFNHFGPRIDRIMKGQLVAPHTVSARCYKGSRLVARAHIDLHTAQYVIYEVGA